MVAVEMHPVSIIGGPSPVGRYFSHKKRSVAFAVHIGRGFLSGEIEERGGMVDVHNHGIDHLTRRNLGGITDDERRRQARLVHEALVEPAMFAEKESLI